MNPPKCNDLDYIHFLIAAQRVFTCTEAARCQPEGDQAPAHDAFTRLLQRQPPDTAALWQEAKAFVNLRQGLLILDDTTLDKPYARRMGLVTYHWSGKHQGVVKGIALLTLLWTAGQALIPCDFRVYDKPQGGKTKNEHFQQMLQQAKARGFAPEYVLMDSWYAGLGEPQADSGLWLAISDAAEGQPPGQPGWAGPCTHRCGGNPRGGTGGSSSRFRVRPGVPDGL